MSALESHPLMKPVSSMRAGERSVSVSSLARTGVATAMLGLAIVGGGISTPAMASAQTAQVQVCAKQMKDPDLRRLLQGLPANGQLPQVNVAAVTARMRPDIKVHFQSLPAPVQEKYLQVGRENRHYLQGQLRGNSEIAIGPFKKTINNREAFIKGKVSVFNVFSFVKSQMHSRFAGCTTLTQMEPQINSLVDSLKNLTPQQRAEVLATLDAEFAPVRR